MLLSDKKMIYEASFTILYWFISFSVEITMLIVFDYFSLELTVYIYVKGPSHVLEENI